MKELPGHWNSTLQALSYWIAYKRQYFSGHLMPEGAIVAELTQLLSANVETGLRIECERMYKDFGWSTLGQERMDITIGKYGESDLKREIRKLQEKEILEAIEVKRYEVDKKKFYQDIEKLASAHCNSNDIRKFLVVVGQTTLPDLFFTEKHNVKKGNVYFGEQNIEAFPRMGKKAYSTKKESFNGAFSVIIEVK